MIEFKSNTYREWTSFEQAEVGDEFSCIFYGQWSRDPSSVRDLKVIRAGKRDIVCSKPDGGEEFRFSRNGQAGNCYPIGHEKIKEARRAIFKSNRQKKCLSILEKNRLEYDDILMDAIEAFEIRNKS
jgi:hypothetical protein